MKQIFAVIVTLGFISNAFADDWRMRKFDLNDDMKIERSELIAAGCSIKATGSLFEYADKNGDDLLNVREARNATHYIFKSKCRKALKAPKADGIRG